MQFIDHTPQLKLSKRRVCSLFLGWQSSYIAEFALNYSKQKGKGPSTKEEQRQVLEDQLQSDIPPFCILPPKPSHDVASRHREVAEITQQLKELKSANENNLSYLYISGNPGSGKSQLAGLVAKQFFDEIKEIPSAVAASFVMTLNAKSPDTLLESFVSFARHLKCPEYAVTNTVNSKDLKTDEKITNLKTLVSIKIKLYTSWLLVVDNVTSISRVHGHLPESGNDQWLRGQLLITTQDTASIPLTSSFIQHISVSKGMEPRDASSLLAKLSGIANSEIEKVPQALDYQPLALASAATYVRQVRHNKATSNFGWNDFLRKLDTDQRSTTEAILAETNPSYPNTMTAVITLAVEEQMTSDKVIDHTFRFLYLYAPQPLSLDIVINYILNVDEEIKDKEMISMRIQRCSLLLFEEEETAVYIRVHQVVHDVINTVITDLPEIQRLQVVNSAVSSFTLFIVKNQSEDWDDLDSLINSKHIVPHLITLVIKMEYLCSKQNISQVIQSGIFNIQCYPHDCQTFGQICIKHCEFNAAKKYFYIALQFLQLSDAYTDVQVADAYFYIGNVHIHLGELQQAKEYHDRALAIRLKKLGPEHVDVAATYSNLGTAHNDLGELQQAKEYHDRALAIRLKKLGPEHVDVAATYSNLGTVHNHLGELQQAKEYHDRALAIGLKKLGPEHVHIATIYNNLGNVHTNLGELQQAKEYHDRALAIRLKKLGPEHVDVAATYSSLGTVHSNLGELQQAKEYHDRVLAILLKKLGPEYVHVATTYNNLGIVHRKLGELQQAKKYHDRALAIFLKKLGPEHVHVANTYSNLGTVHNDLGELLQAKEYHDRALAIILKKLGPEYVHVAATYNNLGIVHRKLGELQQAKKYHDRALAIFLKKLGPEHVHVANTYSNLGTVHNDLGELLQAKEYHDRALAIILKKLGPEHVHVATAYSKLGAVHSKLGELLQAKQYYDRALAIFLKKFGPEHVNVTAVQHNIFTLMQRIQEVAVFMCTLFDMRKNTFF
ncbi:hypothetical protein OS493_026699 [Desmophyllum pertusum]|uniref:Nephrocystin-3 n=1 Tax=Desmophyllum pertusum TaxID=174260 RepID=A0A9W9ZZD8_9CNID|nr:hypothetical protein OS493_026699 [Desmophyllum pertusum]